MAQFNSFQKDIARTYLTTKNNIAVMASAGCGKTTMLVGLAHKIKKPHSFCFLAFTQATAQVLKKRLPKLEPNILTTYSLGYRNAANYTGHHLEVNSYKSENTFDHLINTQDMWETNFITATGQLLDGLLYQLKRNVCQLQKLALLNCFYQQEDILEYAQQLNQGWGYTNEMLQWMSKLAFEITKVNYNQLMDEGIIDFQEMIAWPAMWDDLEPIQFAEIFIDEFQDLSAAQQMLVFKSLQKGGQIVMVGDKSQAIYAFAGADHNSATNMAKLFNAVLMPMPINYRCSKAIIRHAQEIDPVIQAHDEAPEGEVLEASYAEALEHLLDNQMETLVVARTNVLLVKLSLNLLRLDKQFTFQRDVLEDRLIGLIAKATSANPKVPIEDFNSWLQLQRDFAEDKKASLMLDLLECLEVFYKHSRPKSWSTFKRSIKTFFKQASKQSNLTLSTIHAAKGSEAHTVIYWGTNSVPHRLAKTESELQQETNLEYIARTRAIMKLIRVGLEP
jgi:superfamily I DNA/RNA helicase